MNIIKVYTVKNLSENTKRIKEYERVLKEMESEAEELQYMINEQRKYIDELKKEQPFNITEDQIDSLLKLWLFAISSGIHPETHGSVSGNLSARNRDGW